MKRFTPITQFVFTIAFLLALAFTAQAQIDTLNTDAESITFSLAGQNANSTTAITAGRPIQAINGYGVLYVARQTADGKVVSEIAQAQIDGRYKFIEAFIVLERDLHRGIAFEAQTGYRFTPGAYEIGAARVTGGLGNYTASTTVEDAPGGNQAESASISYGWTGYTRLDVWKTSTTLTVEPDIIFKSLEAEIESTIRHAVGKNFEVGITAKGLFNSDPHRPDAGRFHSQYLLFATWTR